MAQARRKSPAKSRPGKPGGGLAGVALLLAGMVIGALATILWQGTQTADDGVGAGIRRMIESVRQPSPGGDEPNAERAPATSSQSARPSTPFDFFTVLPEMEVMVPPAPDTATGASGASDDGAQKQPNESSAPSVPAADGGSYMLQAASYRRRAEADRLKATLALNGMVSAIQKVSIQGRGDFYRVRLGPFPTYAEMRKAEQQLSQAGIKALRLKVSKAG